MLPIIINSLPQMRKHFATIDERHSQVKIGIIFERKVKVNQKRKTERF